MIKKYATKRTALALIITGSVLCAAAYLASIATLFSVYSKVDDSDACAVGACLTTEETIANVAVWFVWIGAAVLLAGLVLMVVLAKRHKLTGR